MLQNFMEKLAVTVGLKFQISVCIASVIFFLLDVAHDLLISAELTAHFYLESLFAVLLGFAVLTQISQLLTLRKSKEELIQRLEMESVDVHELIQQRFQAWKLSPSEHEVAALLFKGFSVIEIADLRGKAVGTVKAQMSGIYRKAEVGSLSELMMLVIDDVADQKSKQSNHSSEAQSENSHP